MLENYTRDFHNLIEWFKVKWAYENSSPPLRRTPLAWEVRKTSPCRIWNSSIVPKCTSPLQRVSPTEFICRSPIDQTICENKIVTDNKVNHVKEEFVYKLLKDNKNNVCKNCSSDIKEKRKNGDKIGNQTTNKEKSTSTKALKVFVKQSVQSKANSFADRKMLNESNAICDSKNKMDIKNVPKQTKDTVTLHSNIVKLADSNLSVEKQESCKNDKDVQLILCSNCELRQKENNGVNIRDSKTDGKNLDNKSCNKTNIGLAKHEINAKVKKDSIKKCENNHINTERINIKAPIAQNTSEKVNQVNCQINKHSHDKSNNKDIRNTSSSSVINNASRPAYSTVSQTKSKVQSSTSSETPKFIRSKTCLSDKNLSASNKTRPGTSVIVRERFQTPENKVFFY